jgi:hypothetical protein
MKIKQWDGTTWVQKYPEVNIGSIVATGDALNTTFLRGDGVWATTGDVVGPASSVTARIATFNGTTGKLIQDSGTLISSLATSTHSHGNINNSGQITSAAQTVANGDYLLIRDVSNSSLVSTGPVFGTSTTTFLANDGVFRTPAGSGSGTVTSITAGAGLTGGTITESGTIAHADTSSQSSVNNSGSTFIQDITLDTYGHITAIGSSAVPVASVDGLTGAVVTEALTTSTSTVNSVLYGRTLGQAIIDSVGTRMRISTGFFAPTGSSTSSSISFGTTFAAVPMVVVFILKASTTTTTAVVAKATAVSTTGATVTCSFVTPSTSGYTVSTETYGWIAIGY